MRVIGYAFFIFYRCCFCSLSHLYSPWWREFGKPSPRCSDWGVLYYPCWRGTIWWSQGPRLLVSWPWRLSVRLLRADVDVLWDGYLFDEKIFIRRFYELFSRGCFLFEKKGVFSVVSAACVRLLPRRLIVVALIWEFLQKKSSVLTSAYSHALSRWSVCVGPFLGLTFLSPKVVLRCVMLSMIFLLGGGIGAVGRFPMSLRCCVTMIFSGAPWLALVPIPLMHFRVHNFMCS